MDGRLRNRRRAAAGLLLVLLAAAPPCAQAQQFVCWPIAGGDTVSGLARHLTGNARAAYTDAFQIRDPARQMFVPKSQYRRPLKTHWEACVAIDPVTAPLARAQVVATAAPAVPAADPAVTSTDLMVTPARSALAPSARSQPGFTFVVTIGSAVLAMVLIGIAVGGSLTPQPIPPDLHRAGEAFVVAFARPLLDSSSAVPPIQARLRFIPD